MDKSSRFDLDKAVDSVDLEGSSADRPWELLDLMQNRAFSRRAGLRKRDLPRFFWRLVAREWSGFDVIPHEAYMKAFAKFRYAWEPECMTLYALRRYKTEDDPDSLAIYNGLPDQLTVYRGQDKSKPPGLSWSTDRKTAGNFARGHRRIYNRNPVILKTTIAKSEIAFVTFDREESEVVLFEPPDMNQCKASTRGIPPRH